MRDSYHVRRHVAATFPCLVALGTAFLGCGRSESAFQTVQEMDTSPTVAVEGEVSQTMESDATKVASTDPGSIMETAGSKTVPTDFNGVVDTILGGDSSSSSDTSSSEPSAPTSGGGASTGSTTDGDSSGSSTQDPGGYSPVSDVALGVCLSSDTWSTHPFSNADIAAVQLKTISAANLNGDVVYRDDQSTSTAQLVRIRIDSDNANKGKLELLNPNGWYCIDYKAWNLNKFSVDIACDAKIIVLNIDYNQSNSMAVSRVGCN